MGNKNVEASGKTWEKPTMNVVATANEICSGTNDVVDEDFSGSPS